MSGVGETVVLQPNGQIGVPVNPVAATSGTTNIANAASSTPPAAIAPPIDNGAISVQAPAPDPTPTEETQASTAVVTTSASPSLPAADKTIVPVSTSTSPTSQVASSSSSMDVVPPPAATSDLAVTSALPPPPAAAVAVVETSPLRAPPAATSEAVPPPATVNSVLVPPAASSRPPSDNVPPVQPSASATMAGAIGDTNVFAPASIESDRQESTASTPSASLSATSFTLASELAHQFSTGSLTSSSVSTASAQRQSTIASHTTTSHVPASSLSASSHHQSSSSSNGSNEAKGDEAQATKNKTQDVATTSPDPEATKEANPTTTFVSGSVTYTGAAAVSAAEFAHNGGGETKKARDGMSSFAIIGIVGGILVFFIILYIGWFQWRKRRSRNENERLEDEDYAANENEFDPYGLAQEKHSGFDFIDQPLSSRRSDRYKSTMTTGTVNPFADPNDQHSHQHPKRGRGRAADTEYVETWYSDPGEAGLGTARSQAMPWYDDRRPSYIDGPQSIYHETNDPSDPFNQESEDQRPRSVLAAPPVPPLPVAYRKSSAPSRPRTDFSYGDFYGGYDSARSRPGTQYTQYTHDQQPQTATTMMDSPNTAAMLPWLHSAESPPLPSPADPRSMPTHQPKYGFGSQSRMPLRGPVAAAMAQTPQLQDRGCQGVIPSFR